MCFSIPTPDVFLDGLQDKRGHFTPDEMVIRAVLDLNAAGLVYIWDRIHPCLYGCRVYPASHVGLKGMGPLISWL